MMLNAPESRRPSGVFFLIKKLAGRSEAELRNIYDIAQLAGVSIATVSRVVNDSPKVSEKTKEKVRAVMEEYNYTPNVFARGLGLNSMKTVGIICPDVADLYMANAVAHLEKSLRCYGYDCILYCSGYAYEDKVNAVNLILQKRIDALILVGSNYAGDGGDAATEYIRDAADAVPVFLINGYVQAQGICCIMSDDYRAVYDAATKLLESGRKRILFLHDSVSQSALEKMRGYEDALRDNGFPVREELKIFVKNTILEARERLWQRSERDGLEFDSVIATEDGLAVGAIKYIRMKGLRIPEDISVIGYNDSELAVCCEPELTSIDSQSKELCESAVEYMMAHLNGQTMRHKKTVPCRLVKRRTTDF